MKKIDVLMDCEGLGISFSLKSSLRKMAFLHRKLGPSLNREGYEISDIAAFASYGRPVDKWEPKIKKELWDICNSYGWGMHWTAGIADKALINYAEKRLADAVLADTVLLITNDHDFIKLVRLIRNSNRLVIVSGLSVNKRLEEVADRALEIRMFLGGDPENILAGGRKPDYHDGPIKNPLPFPTTILK